MTKDLFLTDDTKFGLACRLIVLHVNKPSPSIEFAQEIRGILGYEKHRTHTGSEAYLDALLAHPSVSLVFQDRSATLAELVTLIKRGVGSAAAYVTPAEHRAEYGGIVNTHKEKKRATTIANCHPDNFIPVAHRLNPKNAQEIVKGLIYSFRHHGDTQTDYSRGVWHKASYSIHYDYANYDYKIAQTCSTGLHSEAIKDNTKPFPPSDLLFYLAVPKLHTISVRAFWNKTTQSHDEEYYTEIF